MASQQEQAVAELVRRGRMTKQEGAKRILEIRRGPEPAPQPAAEPAAPVERSPLAPVYETAGAINRGVAAIPDFFIDAGNAALDLSGVETRIPRAGDALEEVTGGTRNFMEPGLARDVIQAGGEMAPAAVSVAGAAKGIPSLFSRQSPVRQKLTELAESGNQRAQKLLQDPSRSARTQQVAEGLVSGSRETAKKTITPAGKVAKDKLATNAIKQGFDEGVVGAIKASNPQTRRKMHKMVSIREEIKRNSLTTRRPWDVAGDALRERVHRVKKINQQAGKTLEQAAEGLKGSPVNVTSAGRQFSDELRELGVRFTAGDDGELKVIFEGSDIEGIPGAEATIKRVIKRLQNLNGDAFEAHRLKRFIDEQVTFGKSEGGLSGRAERALKNLRRGIDENLDAQFDAYKKANDDYSETIQALNAFQDSAGTKVDLFGPNAEKALGVTSRRLMSNTQSRANMLTALDDIDEVLRKHGKAPDDNVQMLALFADELDAVFKPVARTSLGGEVSKAARTAVTEGQSGLIRQAAEAGIDKVRGVNEDAAFREIKKLLAN